MADANHRSTDGSAHPHVHALPSHRMARRARPLPEKLTFFHLFWIFVICSVVGLVVETIVSYPIDGIWKDRAGLVWGPFSPIYGVGGMLITMALWNLRDKSALAMGICAGFVGAGFEFIAGWFWETFFGIVAWSYADQPFNLEDTPASASQSSGGSPASPGCGSACHPCCASSRTSRKASASRSRPSSART